MRKNDGEELAEISCEAYEAGCGTHDGANAMQVFYLVRSRGFNVFIGAVKERLHLRLV
mgnify:CR=1 FL=1